VTASAEDMVLVPRAELEALPQPLRNAAHRAIFHLLDEPVPGLAEPFPEGESAKSSGSASHGAG
jgi:hypothetical protein